VQAFPIRLTAQELMAHARRVTGIEIVDTDFAEPLARLVSSLNEEAKLSEEGAVAMEQRLLRILSNRLRMLRDYERHPEIAEQKIVRPVFLTGSPRTGSTKLQKLLAASGDFLYLPFWQAHTLSLRSGDRTEDQTDRIREASEYIEWFDTHAPKAKHIHGYGTFEPEEETLIYEQGMLGFFIAVIAFVPSFLQWYFQQDFDRQTDFFVRAMKYIQWQFHDGDPRPWLFKYPAHQGMEPLLARIFPDATFVTTNRDPVATLSSMCSLIAASQEAYSEANWRPILGPMLLEGQRLRMLQFLQAREQHPELKIIDISYPDLTRRADKVIDDTYAFVGLPLSARARQAMLGWDRENAQHKHGVHQHNLAEFGLTPEMVNEAFRPYVERYGHLF
jgi:hypothetical protein